MLCLSTVSEEIQRLILVNVTTIFLYFPVVLRLIDAFSVTGIWISI